MKNFNLKQIILDTFVFPAGYAVSYDVFRSKIEVSRGGFRSVMTLVLDVESGIDVDGTVKRIVADLNSQYQTTKTNYENLGKLLLSYEMAVETEPK